MADIELSDNPNVDTGYVTVGDKKHKTQLTAQLDASNIELSDSPNVDTGFVRINGKKHKVKLVASLYGGGGGGGGTGAVDSANGKTGTVILAASDIPMGEDTVESAINDKISQTGGATLQSTDDYGIRGDYCSKYGVIKIGNSKPDITSSTEILWVGPNIIKMPGTLANPSESLVTLANSITHTIHKTTDFDLVYVHGLDELLECDKVCFSRTKPTEEGTCQVWFNGIEWKFRDVNQGNVWTAARCQPLGRVIFTDGAPTRIDYVGWYHPNMYNA